MTDDQLDRLYCDYFRREVPASLPPLHRAEPARAVWSGPPSRLTLAAAVAALLGLGLWLTANFTPARTSPGQGTNFLKNAEADGSKLRDAANPAARQPAIRQP